MAQYLFLFNRLLIIFLFLNLFSCHNSNNFKPIRISTNDINLENNNVEDLQENLQNYEFTYNNLNFKVLNEENENNNFEFDNSMTLKFELSPIESYFKVCIDNMDDMNTNLDYFTESRCLEANNYKSFTDSNWAPSNLEKKLWIKLLNLKNNLEIVKPGNYVFFILNPILKSIFVSENIKIYEFSSGLPTPVQPNPTIPNLPSPTPSKPPYPPPARLPVSPPPTQSPPEIHPPISEPDLSQQGDLAKLDPGKSVSVWNPNNINFVYNRGNLSEIFVPRCVPSQYQNCRYGGAKSKYDSLQNGQTWSMRIYYGDEDQNQASAHTFTVARTETGEVNSAYEVSISSEIGNFNVDQRCKGERITTINTNIQTRLNIYCKLEPNTKYYLNVKFNEIQKCGRDKFGCRFKVLLPSGYPYRD